MLPAYGVEVVRFPIVDPRTPTDPVAFVQVIAALLGRVRQGEFVAIACRGGLDRSGLAAACLLREAGLDADTAITRVHTARRRSLTLTEQQAFVRAWRTWSSSRDWTARRTMGSLRDQARFRPRSASSPGPAIH